VASRREALQRAREERRQAIQRALDSGETLATIGDVLGVTRQRVKQLLEGK
jgi:DNA-directed RNA polymerase sigma subunit (sigma70/sigma32)